MAGINIDANLDGRNFIRGVGDMTEALEDLQDSVTDVQKDGDKSLEKLEKSFAEVAKASREAGDDVKKGLGDGTKRGAKQAEDALDEFKSEANSTAKESAASFDGSAESIVDSFQEIAANAFAGFGPAGAIAGLALAAGIGIATAEFQKSEEAAQKAKERIADMGNAMIEAGAEGEVPLDSIIENLKGIVTNSEDAVKQFKDIQKEAKEAGQDAGALATAYAGGTEALEDQIDAYDKLIDAENERMAAGVEAGDRNIDTQSKQIEKYKDQRDALKAVQEEQKAAAEAEQAWLTSGGNELIAKAEMVSAVDQAYDSLASNVEYFTDKETGLFDTSAYIAAMQEREQALKNYQETLTTSGLSPEAQEFLNSQGTEAASAMLEGYTKAAPDAKKELDRIWKEASKTASGSVKTELDGVVDKKRTAEIDAKVDTAKAEEDLAKITAARNALIRVKYVDRNGVPIPGLN